MLDRRRHLLPEEHATAEAAMASTLIGKQAVVIGAGMAGLTAAAALADRFDQVVVLERDILPSEPGHLPCERQSCSCCTYVNRADPVLTNTRIALE